MDSTTLRPAWAAARRRSISTRVATLPRVAGSASNPGQRWHLQRRNALAPRQLGAAFAAIATTSLLIGTVFAWLGAPFILAFSGIEVAALGAAAAWLAWHAADGETLQLRGRTLEVELRRGGCRDRIRFGLDDLDVQARPEEGALRLLSRERTLAIGAYATASERQALARELRAALHASRQPPAETTRDLHLELIGR